MVASSSIVSATTSKEGVVGNSDSLMDGVLLTQCGSSPHILRRRDGPTKSKLNHPQRFVTTDTRRMIEAKLQKPISPSNTDEKVGRNSKHIRRVRSDNLAQSKRDDPSLRRSIFGNYFKEKPRSHSAPHLVRNPPPPPPPPPPPEISLTQATDQMQDELKSPRRHHRRSSSDIQLASNQNKDQIDPDENQARQIHKINPHHDVHVDYRVFAPTEKQAATSAICYRYRELNRDHEKEYDSLLERQVRVEHSLPPFPSPLIRFCSETTVTVAGNESHSFATRNPNGTKGANCAISSHDREIHYHGVYSLLTPISILRPSRYTNNGKCDVQVPTNPIALTQSIPLTYSDAENERKTPTKLEKEEDNHDISASLASALHFPRSYIDTSPILKNLGSPTPEDVSFSSIVAAEEKKEIDTAPLGAISIRPISTALTASPCLAPDKFLGDNITGERSGLANTMEAMANDHENGPTYETVSIQSQQHQRLRFDPRVTVTEFEDPIPRKWYDEHELDQLKREAIAVAQGYLREHRAVADWYRRATLDPITKTYRKRALYSLPVFSSTYSSTEAEPKIHCIEDSELTVKRVLIVDPNPVILELFGKSMRSMFPSAEIRIARSAERALQSIKESAVSEHGGNGFDMIVVDQILGSGKRQNKQEPKREDTCLPGIFDVFLKKEPESPIDSPPTSSRIHHGSQLIEEVCKLSLEEEGDSLPSSRLQSLLIGVSIRPERDAVLMRRAGADVVWGIPIPKVGNGLRNKLLSKLHAKRSLRKSLTSSQVP
eukprot:CAMPEP_0172361568 /NCGR_PEP_ID=MMETSP1060-20121228/5378_1 /TAXON_ID=37318 /ORGANISM="Pseudo-nitzschia pungens, Strain cf. cingulata" /LENGTH=773 /DNA_ID=CAMNT_0013083861 /DNA_START=232 /DNA_END=2553 /DNA_ORIENTATION=+